MHTLAEYNKHSADSAYGSESSRMRTGQLQWILHSKMRKKNKNVRPSTLHFSFSSINLSLIYSHIHNPVIKQ